MIWIGRFLRFHGRADIADMNEQSIRQFLDYLAIERKVSPNTQKLALNSLVFLFRYGLECSMGNSGDFIRATSHHRLPEVLSQQEVQLVFSQLSGLHYLMAGLLYGAGLRLMACVRLRVKMSMLTISS